MTGHRILILAALAAATLATAGPALAQPETVGETVVAGFSQPGLEEADAPDLVAATSNPDTAPPDPVTATCNPETAGTSAVTVPSSAETAASDSEAPPAESTPAAPAVGASDPEAPPLGGDFFFKLYTGLVDTPGSNLRVTQPALGNDLTFQNVVWDSKEFSGSPYYGYRIGYFLEDVPWLGVALDFNHYKVISRPTAVLNVNGTRFGAPFSATIPQNAILQQYEISHGVNLITFNALGRLQVDVSEEFPHGRFQPYVGFGLGPTVLHPEATIDGVHQEQYEWGNLGVQAMVGVSYLLIPEVDLFAEYRFTHTSPGTSVSSGTAGTDLNSHHLSFGTGFHW